MPNHTILKYVIKLILVSFIFISCNKETKIKEEKKNIVKDTKNSISKLIYGYNKDSVNIFKNTIRRNQNLSEILRPFKVSFEKINEIALASEKIHDVKKLVANKEYEIIYNKNGDHHAKCMIYHTSAIEYVMYEFSDSVNVSKKQFNVTSIEKTSSGTITSSLYNSLKENGNSTKLAVELSDIYAWQIDFFGIQKGDNYKIVFDELYIGDKYIGTGNIKAAYFKHMNSDYYAFRYKHDGEEEYFDEKGNSLRKAFLKAPLSYRRVSSKFSRSRLHPILKRRMPHLGVDYAAAKGTPVYAIGDGNIIKAKYEGAAGNYVKIKHNSTFTSGYMHLFKFGENIRSGKNVKQGQLIGYVGSTGRSTGPHLDFRIWKNGQAVDPLKLKPPSVKPITKSKLSEYLESVKEYRYKLDKTQSKTVTNKI